MSFYSSKVEPNHEEAPTNMDENSFIREWYIESISNQEVEVLIHKRPIASAISTSEFKEGSWPYLTLP
jgi:hypothetical protein